MRRPCDQRSLPTVIGGCRPNQGRLIGWRPIATKQNWPIAAQDWQSLLRTGILYLEVDLFANAGYRREWLSLAEHDRWPIAGYVSFD